VGLFWAARSRRVPRRAVIASLGLAITGGFAGVVWANAAPPPQPTPPWQAPIGQVVVEIGAPPGEMILVLSDQHLAELQKALEERPVDRDDQPVKE